MTRVIYCMFVFLVTLASTVSSWAESTTQGVPGTASTLIRKTVIITEESMGWEHHAQD